jgi:hypothetical protein
VDYSRCDVCDWGKCPHTCHGRCDFIHPDE